MSVLSLGEIGTSLSSDLKEVIELNLSGKSIKELEDLSPCVSLRKLRLDENQLENLECLEYCNGLTWLSVRSNRLHSFGPLSRLSKLTVFSLLFSFSFFFFHFFFFFFGCSSLDVVETFFFSPYFLIPGIESRRKSN